MKVGGQHFRTIWLKPGDDRVVQLIDQRFLPHRFVIEDVSTVAQMATAIRDMHVRGAGLIGASAGYGMYLAAIQAADTGLSQTGGSSTGDFDRQLAEAATQLKATRPTAVNLAWAVERVFRAMSETTSSSPSPPEAEKEKARIAGDTPAATEKSELATASLRPDGREIVQRKIEIALRTATAIADEDAEHCRMIGEHGLKLIEQIARKKDKINILTHCNAGWLAFVDYGSALAPVYAAHDRGIPVHVWVDETRPRSQGSKLTAWELGQHGVPHTIIADSAGGHLMQRGEVDLVIVGSDRTTRTGDVANKIGTYLKALAAEDNGVPFYVALPSSSFDWTIRDGLEIPIEERGAEEIKHADGWHDGKTVEVRVAPEESPAANYGFDVTPRSLVSGLITERGMCKANEKSILELFPEHASRVSAKRVES
jgi:methylthioribose-1-phosphate isomerase